MGAVNGTNSNGGGSVIKPPKTLKTLVQNTYKQGTVTGLYRISKEQAKQIKEAEKRGQGLKTVLQILFTPKHH
jgi:hypothetical protein